MPERYGKKITRRSGLFIEASYAGARMVSGYCTGTIHFASASVGEAAMVPSLVDVPTVAVSVDSSVVAVAGSLVAADESADVAVVSSSASAAVVSHPNTRATNTDASFRFTADPLLRD